ncbi:MAG: Asp-tRNA(Asn)/Glu-tRNA(Gln) amidotransferase subunit GatC, partial [Nanoarchaeota archaeon]
YAKDIGSTLNYLNKLNEVDTKDVEPTPQVTGLENVTREDKTRPSLTQEEALTDTKSTQNGYFKVPRILD